MVFIEKSSKIDEFHRKIIHEFIESSFGFIEQAGEKCSCVHRSDPVAEDRVLPWPRLVSTLVGYVGSHVVFFFSARAVKYEIVHLWRRVLLVQILRWQ